MKNVADAKSQVLAALKDRAKPDTAPIFPNSQERVTTSPKPFPGANEPANNIPYSNARHFVDREDPTKELHVKLQQHAIVVISDDMGKGGVGKTELAVQYSRKHLRDYPGGCCWLYPDRADLLTQLVEFAYVHFENFQLPDSIESNEGKIAYCWKQWHPGKTLLIFDNVTDPEDIQPYLPTGKSNFKVLITTRRSDLPYPCLSLGGLPHAAAQELLGQLLGGTEVQDKPELALQLCEFCRSYSSGDLSTCRIASANRRVVMLEDLLAELQGQQVNNPEAGTEAALDLNWAELKPETQRLALLISIFALAPIPFSLLQSAADNSEIEVDVKIGCQNLIERYLLQAAGEEKVQLHERVREWLKEKLDVSADLARLKQGFCQIIANVASEIPEALTLSDIATFSDAIPHFIESATEQQEWLADDDLIRPYVGLGRFL